MRARRRASRMGGCSARVGFWPKGMSGGAPRGARGCGCVGWGNGQACDAGGRQWSAKSAPAPHGRNGSGRRCQRMGGSTSTHPSRHPQQSSIPRPAALLPRPDAQIQPTYPQKLRQERNNPTLVTLSLSYSAHIISYCADMSPTALMLLLCLLSVEKLRRKGEATFLSPNAVQLKSNDVNTANMIIEAQHFLIATGSVPRQMAKLQLDGEYIVTPQQASLPCLLATP